VAKAGTNALASFSLSPSGTVSQIDAVGPARPPPAGSPRWGSSRTTSNAGSVSQTGAAGIVDELAISPGGALAGVGSVTAPGAEGGEGIVAL
jgi:hypothetical protein